MPTGRNSMLAALFFSALPILAAFAVAKGYTSSASPQSPQSPQTETAPVAANSSSSRAQTLLNKLTPAEIAADSLEEMRKNSRADKRLRAANDGTVYLDPMPRNFMPGGVMYVDTVAFTGQGLRGTFNAEAVVDSNGTIEINGWAIDTVLKNSGAAVQLVFASKDSIKIVDTQREERPDIVNVYNGEGYRHSGFTSQTNVNIFEPGDYRIYVRVVCMENAGCQQHDTGRKLSVVKPSGAGKEEEF